jgi:hypothetical protein
MFLERNSESWIFLGFLKFFLTLVFVDTKVNGVSQTHSFWQNVLVYRQWFLSWMCFEYQYKIDRNKMEIKNIKSTLYQVSDVQNKSKFRSSNNECRNEYSSMNLDKIFFFNYIFSITFPMLAQKSPMNSTPLPYPPIPTFWHWHSAVLGHIKFVCPVGLSFQWCPTRPSFDTYAARVKSYHLNGLVGYHWEERPLGLANFICLSTGEHKGQEVGVMGRGGGRVRGTFGIAFEM